MSDSTKESSVLSLLRDKPVRTLTFAQSTLSIGIFLQTAVLGKQIFDISGHELDLGLLGLAEFLPAAILVLVTGAVADRFDRRRVALFAIVGELFCTAFFVWYATTDPTAVGPLFAIAAGFGTARAFAGPATRAMPPMVAPEGSLHRVIALNSAIFTTAFIIGPGASGFLYAIDPSVAYIVAAVLMTLGFSGMLRVRFRRSPPRPDPGDRPTLHSALEGLRFIRRTPVLFAAISLDLFAVLFGGAVALLPSIAEDRLGVGDIAYGWLRAAIGIGSAITAIAIAIRPIDRHVGKVLLVAVAVFGLGTIVLGITHSYFVAFLAIMVLSAADMVSVYIRGTLAPLLTPDDKRGRVLAVESVFIGASNELGAFESGVTASWFGTQVAVISGGVLTIGVVGFFWVRYASLRVVDRFRDVASAT
ncbi:MAG: MFS transporter [Acidimicrobiales bacterium]